MAAQTIAQARPPGPSLRLSIPLLVLGVLGAIVSFVGLGEALVHTLSGAVVMTTPGSEQVSCRAGTYVLYVEAGSTALKSEAVVVTGPGGVSVPLQLETVTETVTRYGEQFSGQLGFVVTTPGTYTVSVRTGGTSLVVAPSFTTTARENLGWVVLLLVSMLAGLVGLILLIVGVVQRSSAKRRMASYGGGPWRGPPGPGWPGGPPPGSGWTGQPGWGSQPGPPGWGGQPGWPPPVPPAQPGWPPPVPPAQPGWPPPPGPPAQAGAPGAEGGPTPPWGQPSGTRPPAPSWATPAEPPATAGPSGTVGQPDGEIEPEAALENAPDSPWDQHPEQSGALDEADDETKGWPQPSSKPTYPPK